MYLPPGEWIDYQSGEAYEGARWHEIAAGDVPIVLLVRSGAVIPHIALAQSTADMDWSELELRVFGDESEATGLVALPGGEVHELRLVERGGAYELVEDPLGGEVTWRVVE